GSWTGSGAGSGTGSGLDFATSSVTIGWAFSSACQNFHLIPCVLPDRPDARSGFTFRRAGVFLTGCGSRPPTSANPSRTSLALELRRLEEDGKVGAAAASDGRFAGRL